MTVELVAAALVVLSSVLWVTVVRGPKRRGKHERAPAGPVPADLVGRLAHGLRRRRWLRRTLSLGSVGLVLVALGMLGYPFYTNLYQSRVQSRLDRELASPELQRKYMAGQLEDGDSLTRIKIASIGVDMVVVEGTTASALRAGAGHYPDTPLPCESGNVAIAGHRTTYGKPFANLDLVKPGDEVVLETPIGRCKYRVQQEPWIITPTDYRVISSTPTPTLTLTTCHPKGSAAQRLVLQAVLQGKPVQA